MWISDKFGVFFACSRTRSMSPGSITKPRASPASTWKAQSGQFELQIFVRLMWRLTV